MTKKYEIEFSNRVRLKLKITATTGRPGLPGAGHRPANSEIAASFFGVCEPEDVARVQAECDQFLKECAADASRLAGGMLIFEPVPVPTHENKIKHPPIADQEAPGAATESHLDESVPGPGSTIADNGEAVAPAIQTDPQHVESDSGEAASV